MLRWLSHFVALVSLASTAGALQSASSFDGDPAVTANDSTRVGRTDPPRFVEITAGAAHACALTDNGQVWCWGANNLGQLGVGSIGGTFRSPTRISSERSYVGVAAGAMHTCAITTHRTVDCWGFDSSGQLGRGEASSECVVGPCNPLPSPVASLRRFDSIVAGHQHTCATSGGEAWCWGSDARGQLGIDDTSERCEGSVCARAPRRVSELTHVVSLSAGSEHSCAIVAAESTWCWGDNRSGQLGIGQPQRMVSVRPVRVATTDRFTSISSGATHTCGLAVDGAVACWGDNAGGQLGAGFTNRSDVPLRESTRLAWRAISAAARTSCGLGEGGDVRCWGFAAGDRLGTSAPDSCDVGPCARLATPVPQVTRAARIAVGGMFACVLTTGVVRCWGTSHNLLNELEDRRVRRQLE
jgi:alpha-tubulin suppressor-like RCC1 family protein